MVSDSFLFDLRKAGLKLTSPRRGILNVLSSDNPFSVQEVLDLLKQKGFKTDLVTVYRTLELFQNLGIVNKIQFEDNFARYELALEDEHHHHLVCVKCGRIDEVEINEKILTKEIDKKTDFKILRHSLEFFGLCNRCK